MGPMRTTTQIDSWWAELFDAIDAKDVGRFAGFLADEAEFRFGSGPIISGKAAIATAVSEFFRTIDRSRHDVIRIWDDRETRACQGGVTYTRLDRTTVTIPFVNVFEMQGEEIRRYLIYVDIAPLFAANPST